MAKSKPTKPKVKPGIRLKLPRNPTPPPVEYQFRPGQSGNPSGRPKLLGESYKQMLARVNERDAQGRTNAELLADAAKVQALQGSVGALREIRQATEGDVLKLESLDDAKLADAIRPILARLGLVLEPPGEGGVEGQAADTRSEQPEADQLAPASDASSGASTHNSEPEAV